MNNLTKIERLFRLIDTGIWEIWLTQYGEYTIYHNDVELCTYERLDDAKAHIAMEVDLEIRWMYAA